MKNDTIKHYILYVIIALPLILLLTMVDPITQNQAYHHFADGGHLLGLPNFHNVISNLFFVIFPILGFLHIKNGQASMTPSWFVYLIGVLFVGPGSAYYHYNPNDMTLIWDRLPMTIGFMGLASFVFTDVFKIKKEIPFLILLLAIGFYSIFHWVQFQDLRVYYWVQLTPLLAIIYTAFALPTPVLKPKYLIIAVIFYIFAKMTEKYDHQIYDTLNYSGHSIKHLLAGVSVYSLILMKKIQDKKVR
jgi:hypothetical protein